MTPHVQDPDFTLYVGDVLDVLRTLPDESVDCCVTSPPYWGLRDYGVQGQIGLEATPAEYVARMVDVFSEVRRVLADHGTCWINLGDSYAGGRGFSPDAPSAAESKSGKYGAVGALRSGGIKPTGSVKAKDLVGIPWRVAFALQDDGWWLRSDIVWSKPNPMPESVTDRPTKAHEYVFLLTKQPRYWFDQEAVREPATYFGPNGGPDTMSRGNNARPNEMTSRAGVKPDIIPGRNVRSVWSIATQPYAEAHFATFPQELPRRCIKAGCPEWVCRTCGKPRERIVERAENIHSGDSGRNDVQGTAQRGRRDDGKAIGTIMRERFQAGREATTLGWSDCGCEWECGSCMYGVQTACVCAQRWRPGVVLDPFLGSGTTALVARELGRHSVGIELNPEYARLAARRLQQLSLLAEGAA